MISVHIADQLTSALREIFQERYQITVEVSIPDVVESGDCAALHFVISPGKVRIDPDTMQQAMIEAIGRISGSMERLNGHE